MESLKTNFILLKNTRENIINLLQNLELRVSHLKQIYNELIQENYDSNISTLDTFYFQTKLIKIELENNNRLFNIIDNRIYGNYYKLYKSITKYIFTHYKDHKIIKLCNEKSYPIYNDLDNLISYDFNCTIEIYENILNIIEQLHEDLSKKSQYLKIEQCKKNRGLNIDNLLNNLKYNNSVLSEQIILFENYSNVYNTFHLKYLSRFNIKVKLFYGQVTSDINLELTNKHTHLEVENTIYLNNIENEDIRSLLSEVSNNNSDYNIQNDLDELLSNISSPEQINDISDTKDTVIRTTPVEPIQFKPIQEEPIPEEPIQVEPIPVEPIQEEPIPIETIQVEPIPEETIQVEPIPEEPIQVEPMPIEPIQVEPIPEEPIPIEPIQVEPMPIEPIPEEPIPEEPIQEEPIQEEPIPIEPIQEEPIPIVPIHDEPIVVENSVQSSTVKDKIAIFSSLSNSLISYEHYYEINPTSEDEKQILDEDEDSEPANNSDTDINSKTDDINTRKTINKKKKLKKLFNNIRNMRNIL